MERFWRTGQELAKAETPDVVVDAIRLGRITALSKPSGGVRGIVSGNIIRRSVARTVAQQLNPDVEKATAPFQFALTTRCGGECVRTCHPSHDRYRSSCDSSVRGWIRCFRPHVETSTDGRFVGGGQSSPSLRSPILWCSVFLLVGDVGHTPTQGEGGEKGDALMPLLFSRGALQSVASAMLPGERLFASWDDVGTSPVSACTLEETQLWNRVGEEQHTSKNVTLKTKLWSWSPHTCKTEGVLHLMASDELGCSVLVGAQHPTLHHCLLLQGEATRRNANSTRLWCSRATAAPRTKEDHPRPPPDVSCRVDSAGNIHRERDVCGDSAFPSQHTRAKALSTGKDLAQAAWWWPQESIGRHTGSHPESKREGATSGARAKCGRWFNGRHRTIWAGGKCGISTATAL